MALRAGRCAILHMPRRCAGACAGTSPTTCSRARSQDRLARSQAFSFCACGGAIDVVTESPGSVPAAAAGNVSRVACSFVVRMPAPCPWPPLPTAWCPFGRTLGPNQLIGAIPSSFGSALSSSLLFLCVRRRRVRARDGQPAAAATSNALHVRCSLPPPPLRPLRSAIAPAAVGYWPAICSRARSRIRSARSQAFLICARPCMGRRLCGLHTRGARPAGRAMHGVGYMTPPARLHTYALLIMRMRVVQCCARHAGRLAQRSQH
jgi:hypothetical protein